MTGILGCIVSFGFPHLTVTLALIQALHWYNKAAEKGHADAMTSLAGMYIAGGDGDDDHDDDGDDDDGDT